MTAKLEAMMTFLCLALSVASRTNSSYTPSWIVNIVIVSVNTRKDDHPSPHRWKDEQHNYLCEIPAPSGETPHSSTGPDESWHQLVAFNSIIWISLVIYLKSWLKFDSVSSQSLLIFHQSICCWKDHDGQNSKWKYEMQLQIAKCKFKIRNANAKGNMIIKAQSYACFETPSLLMV